jgi:WD40 repeat protein
MLRSDARQQESCSIERPDFDSPNAAFNLIVDTNVRLPMLIRSSLPLLVVLGITAHLGAVEPKILTGHADPAYSAVYTPDGSKLVTGSFDKTLRLWDLNSSTTLRSMAGHTGLVLCVAITKDGSRLASGSLDNTIRLWDVPVAKPSVVHQANQGSTNLAINADGTQWLTGGADKILRIWNAADRQLVKEMPRDS